MVYAEQVSFAYDQTPVLEEFSLRCDLGQMVGLLGRSGSGKTTALNLLTGYLRPSRGMVRIDGKAPSAIAASQKIGLVQQGAAGLLPHLTVFQNVALPLLIGRCLVGVRQLSSEDRGRVAWALEHAHISHAAGQYPHQLSGGMLARTTLARAIVTRPLVLPFDEPFASLDDVVLESIYSDLQAVLSTTSAAGILVSHRLDEVILLCDQVLVLHHPHSGAPTRIVHREEIPFARPRTVRIVGDPQFVAIRNRLREQLE